MLSRFKFITSQNLSQSIPLHFALYEIEMTEQGLSFSICDEGDLTLAGV
jgi:hypothetical protein